MMADLVNQHMGDDLAQRVGVFGPVVEYGASVESHPVGHLAGMGDDAIIRPPDPLEQPHQIERAFKLHVRADVFGGKFGHAAFDVTRHRPEWLGQRLQRLDGEGFYIVERGGRQRPP